LGYLSLITGPVGLLVTFMSHLTGPVGLLVTFMSHLNSQDFVVILHRLGSFHERAYVHGTEYQINPRSAFNPLVGPNSKTNTYPYMNIYWFGSGNPPFHIRSWSTKQSCERIRISNKINRFRSHTVSFGWILSDFVIVFVKLS
jgi:hypothetical protein